MSNIVFMKFFLDSANINEIEEIASLGLLDGVTTNPSLVAKENGQQDFAKIIKKICKIAKGPVSAEVISTEFENMIKEAEEKLTNNKVSDKQKYILNYKIETLKQIN